MCKRLIIYSHDTYGLGHLRRAVRIAEALSRHDPASRPQVLIITGSPREFAFRLPDGCDVLKLPSVLKQPTGAYASRSLGLRLGDMVALRSELIMSAIERFEPDAVLVDHAPMGMGGELVPVLDRLHGREDRPAILLGLRDIIDDVEAIGDSWTATEAASIRFYDEVLVYGDARLPTTAVELRLEERLGIPVHHVGMLVPDVRVPTRRSGEVVVACGGGGDAKPLLRAIESFVETCEPLDVRLRIITGPLLSRRRREEMCARLEKFDGVTEVATFDDDLCARIAAASGVISMGGYNSVMEILACRTPALIAARTSPRREQIVRARRLERHGVLRACELEQISPDVVGEFIASLDGSSAPAVPLATDGLVTVAARVSEHLGRPCPDAGGKEQVDVVS